MLVAGPKSFDYDDWLQFAWNSRIKWRWPSTYIIIAFTVLSWIIYLQQKIFRHDINVPFVIYIELQRGGFNFFSRLKFILDFDFGVEFSVWSFSLNILFYHCFAHQNDADISEWIFQHLNCVDILTMLSLKSASWHKTTQCKTVDLTFMRPGYIQRYWNVDAK